MSETKQVLVFQNPGQIDIRAVVTLGVSVKENENPIGQFGTGLKYAIAGVLRLGGSIEIFSGGAQYTFISEIENIRGKDFEIVRMEGRIGSRAWDQPLGFTTALGQHWKDWWIYRELWSNARDEGGTVWSEEKSLGVYPENETTVVVDCPPLLRVHLDQDEFFINRESALLWTNDEVEIWEKQAQIALAAKGIRMLEDEMMEDPGKFSYNILKSLPLTEDRTLARAGDAREIVAKVILGCTDAGLVERWLDCEENWERKIDLDLGGEYPPSAALATAILARLREGKWVSGNTKAMMRVHWRSAMEEAELPPVPKTMEEMLDQAPVRPDPVNNYPIYEVMWKFETAGKEETARAEYWRACALDLARRLAVLEPAELLEVEPVE